VEVTRFGCDCAEVRPRDQNSRLSVKFSRPNRSARAPLRDLEEIDQRRSQALLFVPVIDVGRDPSLDLPAHLALHVGLLRPVDDGHMTRHCALDGRRDLAYVVVAVGGARAHTIVYWRTGVVTLLSIRMGIR
jgi:hypothetical protein